MAEPGGRGHLAIFHDHDYKVDKAKARATIRYLGGVAGVFACPFLFISQGRLKALFFYLDQDRLEIFISIFILYFDPPLSLTLWIKYLFQPPL